MSHRADVQPEPLETPEEAPDEVGPAPAVDLWPTAEAVALPPSVGRHAGGAEATERTPAPTPDPAPGWASFGNAPTAQQVDSSYGASKPWLEDLIADAAPPVVAPPPPLADPTVERVTADPVAAPVEPEAVTEAPGATSEAPPPVSPVRPPTPPPVRRPDPEPVAATPAEPTAAPPVTEERRSRPLLRALLVVVAVVVVGAVAWAVSGGNAATAGIAAGVAAFTLGLLAVLLGSSATRT